MRKVKVCCIQEVRWNGELGPEFVPSKSMLLWNTLERVRRRYLEVKFLNTSNYGKN